MNNGTQALKKFVPACVLFVVFLVAALAIPFDKHNPTYWIAFCFSLVAIGVFAYVMYVHGSDERAISRFYHLPILRLAVIYLAVQLLAGFAFMGFGLLCPPWIPLVLFVILLGVALVGILFAANAREQIESIAAAKTDNTRRMKILTQDMMTVAGRCGDPALSNQLMQLAERFRYSDPVSSPASIPAEDSIYAAVNNLKNAVNARDHYAVSSMIGEISNLLDERNRLCMAYKQ